MKSNIAEFIIQWQFRFQISNSNSTTNKLIPHHYITTTTNNLYLITILQFNIIGRSKNKIRDIINKKSNVR